MSNLIDRIKVGAYTPSVEKGFYTISLCQSSSDSSTFSPDEFSDVSDSATAPKVDPGSLDHIDITIDATTYTVTAVDLAAEPDAGKTHVRDPNSPPEKGKPKKEAKAAALRSSVPETKAAIDVDVVINNVMHQSVLGDLDEAERLLVSAIHDAQQAAVDRALQHAPSSLEPVQTVYVTVDQEGREVPRTHATARQVGITSVRDLWSHVLGSAPGAGDYGLPVWDAPPALRPILYDVSALHHKHDLRTICQVIQNGGHLWLTGHKGTGKTTFAMSLAQVCRRPFFRIQHHAQTEALDLLGSKGLRAGETVFEPGILLTAMQTAGAVILLDEPTLASLTLSVYQSILDEGFIQLDDRVCRLAPGVTFICADNTAGSGDTSMIYHGTAPVNASFLDRFDAVIKMDYLPRDAEVRLLSQLTGLPEAKCKTICTFAQKVRDAVHGGSVAEPISFRRLVAFAKALLAGVPKQVALANTIVSFVVSPSDRETYVQLANGHL
jgi:MoxR-like ATPase